MSHRPTFYGKTVDLALWNAAQDLDKSPADLEFASEEIEGGLWKVEILGVPERKGKAPAPPKVEAPAAAAAAEPADASAAVEVPALPDTKDAEEMARGFLGQLSELGGFGLDFELIRKESQLVLEFDEAGRAQLMGGGGRLLDSVQYLLNRVVQKHVDPAVTLMADVGDEVRSRAGRLAAMAQELADKAVEMGYPVHIEAALSPDRRAIHTALAARRDVRTESDGAGAFRKLVITPRQQQPPQD